MPRVDRIALEQYHIRFRTAFSEHMLNELNLRNSGTRIRHDPVIEALIAEVEFKFYGEDSTVFRYTTPSDWWEYVKHGLYYYWFPKHFEWVGEVLRKKWPVRTVSDEYDLLALYPNLQIKDERYIFFRTEGRRVEDWRD